MLVLTRRPDQFLVVGSPPHQAIITVAVEGGKARVGIRAPMSVPILRGELDEAKAALAAVEADEAAQRAGRAAQGEAFGEGL